MFSSRYSISRRTFLRSASFSIAGAASSTLWLPSLSADSIRSEPLAEFGYGDVVLRSELHERQLLENHAVLMGLSEDSLLKPMRQMAGQPAPGAELGGWYLYDPNYDISTFGAGFAPEPLLGSGSRHWPACTPSQGR